MPVEIAIDIFGVPQTSFECGRFAADDMRRGNLARSYFWNGMRYLMDAQRMKKARPQAERLLLAWTYLAKATVGDQLFSEKKNATLALEIVLAAIRKGTEGRAWIREIEDPVQAALEKAKTTKQSIVASRRGVKGFIELLEVFNIGDKEWAQQLFEFKSDGRRTQIIPNWRVFWDDWCAPMIEERLNYWREQLAFVEMRLAEKEA